MRPTLLAPIVLGAALLFAGCATNAAKPSAMPVTSWPTSEPTSTLVFSPRGALEVAIGEEGIMSGSASGDGPEAARFTLDAATWDPACDAGYGRDGRAHNEWLQLDFTVKTGSFPLSVDALSKPQFYAVTDAGEIVEVGKTQGDFCMRDASWFGVEDGKPNATYSVMLLLDVPENVVTVGYDSPVPGSDSSWEWAIPANV